MKKHKINFVRKKYRPEKIDSDVNSDTGAVNANPDVAITVADTDVATDIVADIIEPNVNINATTATVENADVDSDIVAVNTDDSTDLTDINTDINEKSDENSNTENVAADEPPPESESPQFKGWKAKAAQFVAAQSVSLFGSAIVRYAIMWYIMLETQSGMMTTVITLCSFLPQMLVSMFAGTWADRYDRKKLIIISDSFIAMSSLALAVYFILGGGGIWMMFVVTALSSFGTGIQTPAVSALIPQIVPKDKLARINSIMSGLQSVIMLLTPALSAFVLSNFDLYVAFGIDVITAITAVIITALLAVKPLKRVAKIKQNVLKDLGDSLKFIGSQRYLKLLMILLSIMMFAVTPAAMLTPLQVTRTYGDNVFFLSFVEIAFSVGMLIGGIIMGVTGGFKDRMKSITFAFFCFGAFTAMLGISGLIPFNFYIYATFMLLLGLSLPAMNIAFTTLLQENIKPDMMGRVFGIVTIINTSIMPLGMLLFGPLADIIRIEWLLIITAALQFLIVPFTKLVKVPIKSTTKAPSPKADC